MKALALRAPAPIEQRPLEVVERQARPPGAGEVRLDVLACGICRTDLHVVEGELPVHRENVVPGHQIVGRVAEVGPGACEFAPGDRIGVAWLHRTCGVCRACRAGRENLCDTAEFTGWTVDGGYAEQAVVPAAFAYRLPDGFADVQAAPLLCAGIIGFRSLRLTGLGEAPGGFAGARLGLVGFGAAGHVVIQIARARGAEVYVFTRDRERHQALAAELGATWIGGTMDEPPVKLDASIVFAPAGEIVPAALAALEKGATLVLGGIHMSSIPSLSYRLLYGERVLRSVANNTRDDGRAFLEEAARLPVVTRVETFPMARANDALIALKHDAIRGAGVLVPGGWDAA
jgi:propanol-preferring alcohol dehydrogenase